MSVTVVTKGTYYMKPPSAPSIETRVEGLFNKYRAIVPNSQDVVSITRLERCVGEAIGNIGFKRRFFETILHIFTLGVYKGSYRVLQGIQNEIKEILDPKPAIIEKMFNEKLFREGRKDLSIKFEDIKDNDKSWTQFLIDQPRGYTCFYTKEGKTSLDLSRNPNSSDDEQIQEIKKAFGDEIDVFTNVLKYPLSQSLQNAFSDIVLPKQFGLTVNTDNNDQTHLPTIQEIIRKEDGSYEAKITTLIRLRSNPELFLFMAGKGFDPEDIKKYSVYTIVTATVNIPTEIVATLKTSPDAVEYSSIPDVSVSLSWTSQDLEKMKKEFKDRFKDNSIIAQRIEKYENRCGAVKNSDTVIQIGDSDSASARSS